MSLKNLIALQKQKANTIESPAKAASPAQAPSPAPVESESLEADPALSQTPQMEKPKGLGLNVVGRAGFKPATGAAPTKTPASQKPKASGSAASRPAKSPASEPGEFSLDDIAGMTEADMPEAQESSGSYGSGFDDEIEATAPDRELPADLTAEQLSFVESLDGIYQVLHDPEMFGQTVRLIMMELQENEEYKRLLSDSDVHVMIKGARRTMGLSRVKKQEKTRKAGTQKNARKASGVSDSAMDLLNSLMGGGDD